MSLTAVSCKILERIICGAILDHCERNNLLFDKQFAYRTDRSITDALLRSIVETCHQLKQSIPVDAVNTDFKNAFETMPHGHLLSVIRLYGVGTKLTQWMSDFLRNRTFTVKVHDVHSSVGRVSVGCPQGTVCGSLLFLLFIDRLKSRIADNIDASIYADDVKFASPARSEDDHSRLQEMLEAFHVWFVRMRLRLSVHKCGVLHFGSRNPAFEYSIGDSPLQKLKIVRDPGIRLSPPLNFVEHAIHVIRRCSMMTNWIFRSISINKPSVYLKLYTSHVLPIGLYASPVWFPHRTTDMELLKRVQRRFLRRVETRCRLERNS